jgi:hypothetical protein
LVWVEAFTTGGVLSGLLSLAHGLGTIDTPGSVQLLGSGANIEHSFSSCMITNLGIGFGDYENFNDFRTLSHIIKSEPSVQP